MKKMIAIILAVVFTSLSMVQTGCYGKFGLTNKVYKFNKGLGNKFVNELVFLVFIIIQVYSLTVLIDGVILNSIEFWTGSNPISMKPGDRETKIIEANGYKAEITAVQNQFQIKYLEGKNAGKEVDLVYNPATQGWSAVLENETIVLSGAN